MLSNGLIQLATGAFLAATIFPAQSEIMLVIMYKNGTYNPFSLLCAASFGNIAGSCVNWIIGRHIHRLEGKRFFPVSRHALNKASRVYKKYGLWSLLLAWIPFIGDPLTIVAGTLRVPFVPFICFVSIGKIGRYALLLGML